MDYKEILDKIISGELKEYRVSQRCFSISISS